jgi:transposase InsO family protein
MTDELTLKALSMALQHRLGQSKGNFHGPTFHSDKGSQYASADFRLQLQQHSIAQSMYGTGNCFDNPVSDSLSATLKTEEVEPVGKNGYPTRQADKTTIFAYTEAFYNRTRRHSTLGLISPLDFENQNRHNASQCGLTTTQLKRGNITHYFSGYLFWLVVVLVL